MACVDASVLTKLVLTEPDSAAAELLVARLESAPARFAVPQLALAECLSAVYQRLRAREVETDRAHRGIRLLEVMLRDRVSHIPLGVRTLEIAAELGVRYPYDSVYLALAEAMDCDLWTADAAFHKVAAPRYPRVRLLAEFNG